MTPEQKKARETLLAFVPHLKVAIETAKLEAGPGGTVELGVLGTNTDGSGRIVARFEPDFIDDLEILLGHG